MFKILGELGKEIGVITHPEGYTIKSVLQNNGYELKEISDINAKIIATMFVEPTQVEFYENDNKDNINLGIAYRGVIVCLECGAPLPIEDCTIIKIYKDWVPLDEA